MHYWEKHCMCWVSNTHHGAKTHYNNTTERVAAYYRPEIRRQYQEDATAITKRINRERE